MSIVALLFGWTKLPAWVQELIAILLIVLVAIVAIALWDRHVYNEGIAAEDARIEKQNAADKAVLVARATTAESNYAKAKAGLDTFRSANPIGAVRLCVPSPAHVQARPVVANGGSTAPGPSAVPGVPTGDQGSGGSVPGPDVGPLLDLLALAAAKVDAQAIELQQAH